MGRESRLNPFARHATAIDTSEPVVRDSHGRVLQVGDEILLASNAPTLYRVHSVERHSAPGLPPNLMLVRLITTIELLTPRDQPTQEILRVATAEELTEKAGVELTDTPAGN